jgi:uncharacterized Zn finger protein
MSFYGWKPYVPVAERRRKAEKAAAKARKAGADLSPVAPSRGATAKTFWGKAWSDNLERYSDYANRLPRGRTYVRNGSVIDLKILEGEVQAQVMGSSLYQVAVSVTAVPEKQWRSIGADCSGSIDSLVELLQGKLSRAVMERICKPDTGLFPTPKEIRFSCSCPDWASMCKHVAAVLYGVGARLDEQPELIFRLRRVDAKDLVSQAGTGLPKSKHGPAAGKRLDDAVLADVFGIEMAGEASPSRPARSRRDPKPTVKTEVAKTTVAAQKRVNAKVPGNVSAGSRESTASNVTVSKTKTEGQAARPKSTAAATGRIASQMAKDSTAIKVTKMPVKTTATTTQKPRAPGKSIAARKTLAAQQSVEAKAPDKAPASPRRSATGIVAAGKVKTAAPAILPKGKAAKTGNAGGRLKKSKSR